MIGNFLHNVSLAGVVLFLLASCAPPVTYEIHEKEKVIQQVVVPSVPPTPVTDLYRVGRASGSANILWVIDNTYDAETILSGPNSLKNGYEKIAQTIRDVSQNSRFEHVTIHQQVIVMPSGRSPSNPLRTGMAADKHLQELFGGLLAPTSRFNGEKREPGRISPFRAAALGLGNTELSDRSRNTFVIFVVAKSVTTPLTEAEKKNYEQSLAQVRDLSTVNVYHLVGDRDCGVQRPTSFLEESARIGWSTTTGDLCATPDSWSKSIIDWIYKNQSQKRLRFMPDSNYKPVVKIGEEQLGDRDYRYDARTNSIELLVSGYTPEMFVTVNYIRREPVPAGGQ